MYLAHSRSRAILRGERSARVNNCLTEEVQPICTASPVSNPLPLPFFLFSRCVGEAPHVTTVERCRRSVGQPPPEARHSQFLRAVGNSTEPRASAPPLTHQSCLCTVIRFHHSINPPTHFDLKTYAQESAQPQRTCLLPSKKTRDPGAWQTAASLRQG